MLLNHWYERLHAAHQLPDSFLSVKITDALHPQNTIYPVGTDDDLLYHQWR